MQYAYNITTLVPEDIRDEWVKWLIETHIRQMLDTGLVAQHYLYQLKDTDESEGITYTLQLGFLKEDDFLQFRQIHEEEFRKKRLEKWGNACLSFISSMEVIH